MPFTYGLTFTEEPRRHVLTLAYFYCPWLSPVAQHALSSPHQYSHPTVFSSGARRLRARRSITHRVRGSESDPVPVAHFVKSGRVVSRKRRMGREERRRPGCRTRSQGQVGPMTKTGAEMPCRSDGSRSGRAARGGKLADAARRTVFWTVRGRTDGLESLVWMGFRRSTNNSKIKINRYSCCSR